MSTLEQLEKAEFDLLDALSGLPATAKALRARVIDTLIKVKGHKQKLLASLPDVLRKGSAVARKRAVPSWVGLPIDTIAADTFAKEARSRAAEERRLAKRAGEETPQPAIDVLKRTLRTPTATGNDGLAAFLRNRAGR